MATKRKMLQYHDPVGHGTGKTKLKSVAISDVHRMDEVTESSPIYGDGVRSLIYGKPRGTGGHDEKRDYAFVYYASESIVDLCRMIDEA